VLDYDQPFHLDRLVSDGDHGGIDRAFGFLRTQLDERLPDLNRYEKAIAPWFIAEQAMERSKGGTPPTNAGAAGGQAQARPHPVEPRFIILDEMNLARVEYYFAEILSVLESARDPRTGYTTQELPLHGERRPVKDGAADDPSAVAVPPSVALPPGLFVVGTVNTDETTHAFSPKVLDRAFSIEFNEVDLSQRGTVTASLPSPLGEGLRSLLRAVWGPDRDLAWSRALDDPRFLSWLGTLNQSLRPSGFHFGYRVRDEIARFVGYAMTSPLADGFCEHSDDVFVGACDAAVLMKVLPKFHGPKAKLTEPLECVLAWALDPGSPEVNRARVEEAFRTGSFPALLSASLQSDHGRPLLPRVAEKTVRMLADLRLTGFTSFA
jgi:5-methylcytosine-specific restriction protein B